MRNQTALCVMWQISMKREECMQCARCNLPLHPTNLPDHCPRCGTVVNLGNSVNSSFQQFLQEIKLPYSSTKNAFTIENHSNVLTLEQQKDGTSKYSSPNIWPIPKTSIPQAPKPSGLGQPLLKKYENKKLQSYINYKTAIACLMTSAFLIIITSLSIANIPVEKTSALNIAPPPHTVQTRSVTSSATSNIIPTVPPAISNTYIYNAQTASAVNTKTATAESPAANFSTNTRIYVTFNLQTNGEAGDVCVLWYLNTINVSSFDFPVSINGRVAYSYVTYRGTGSAYVELYWANTLGCNDTHKILDQHVDFTVQ